MRRIVATTLVFALCTSAVQADLRYRTQMEVRQTAGSRLPSDVAAALGALMPTGDTQTFLGSGALRMEQGAGATATVLLARPDGQFILYPASRTYARIPLLAAGTAKLETAAPVVRRTAEFATVFGLRAERILVTMTLALPMAPQAGFPTAMTIDAELWIAKAYLVEAGRLRKLMGPLHGLAAELEGMVLKQVLRIAQLGYEVETRVTELVEGPIDATMFDIPAGYRPAELPFIPRPPDDERRRPR